MLLTWVRRKNTTGLNMLVRSQTPSKPLANITFLYETMKQVMHDLRCYINVYILFNQLIPRVTHRCCGKMSTQYMPQDIF